MYCTNVSAYNCKPKTYNYYILYRGNEETIAYDRELITQQNLQECQTDEDDNCYLSYENQDFMPIQAYYMHGDWTLKVNEPLPEEHTFYSRSRNRSDKVEHKTAILRYEDFLPMLSEWYPDDEDLYE